MTMTRRAAPTQTEITRLVKGMLAAGIPRERIISVTATANGGVSVCLGDPTKPMEHPANEWDVVLPK